MVSINTTRLNIQNSTFCSRCVLLAWIVWTAIVPLHVLSGACFLHGAFLLIFVQLHQCSVFILTCTLLLPGQTGEAWNFPKSDVPSEIGKHWTAKYFQLVLKCWNEMTPACTPVRYPRAVGKVALTVPIPYLEAAQSVDISVPASPSCCRQPVNHSALHCCCKCLQLWLQTAVITYVCVCVCAKLSTIWRQKINQKMHKLILD